MVALYFWLHALEHGDMDYNYIRTHLDKPVHIIGKGILDKAKQHFMDEFLSRFWQTSSWCKPFNYSFGVMTNTCRREDSTMHLDSTLSVRGEAGEFPLERHAYSIGIPAEISGPYDIKITRLESYFDALTAKHGAEVLKPYKEAVEAFYGNCERVEDDVYTFTLDFGDPSEPLKD
jgi:hypothetical protein